MLASALSAPKPARFWHFAGAVAAGNLAALGSAYVARKALNGSSEDKRNLTAAFVGMGTFWLVGGLTWVALTSE